MVNAAALKRQDTRQRAFSLVELLTVISVIALLVAILLPSLGRAKELARETKCRANLNTLGKAVTMFAAENNRYVPAGDTLCQWGRTADWLSNMDAHTFFELRDRYLPTEQVFLCPSVNWKLQYNINWTGKTEAELRAYTKSFNTNSWESSFWDVPTIKIPYQYYGVSEWPMDDPKVRDQLIDRNWEVLRIDESNVLGGARPPLFSDMAANMPVHSPSPLVWWNHGPSWDKVMVNRVHTDGSVTWKPRDKQYFYSDLWTDNRDWYW